MKILRNTRIHREVGHTVSRPGKIPCYECEKWACASCCWSLPPIAVLYSALESTFSRTAPRPSHTAQEFSPGQWTVLMVSSEGLTIQKHLTLNYATNFLRYIHEDEMRFAKCFNVTWHLALPQCSSDATPAMCCCLMLYTIGSGTYLAIFRQWVTRNKLLRPPVFCHSLQLKLSEELATLQL